MTEGKQINGFTNEEEDVAPLNLAPSPADQRKLAAPPHTEPLPVLADRAVKARGSGDNPADVDLEAHRGGSLTQDFLPGQTPLPVIHQHDTPELNRQDPIPVQGVDVPPANDIAIDDEGAKVSTEGEPYPGQDTKAFTESTEARKAAKAERRELPEVEPAVIGQGITAENVGVPGSEQKSDEDDDADEDDKEEGNDDEVSVPTSGHDRTTKSKGKTWKR